MMGDMKSYRSMVGKRVVLNLTNGDGLVGTLTLYHGGVLDLHDAELLDSRENQRPLTGVAAVPETSVVWVQVVSG